MHANTTKLLATMRRHKLTADDVARITNRQRTTVAIWRCRDDRRVIPAELLRLVELEAKAKAARKQERAR